MLQRIFAREELQAHPPVLVDIGASGAIHQKWTHIAPYSICIAFDADSRKMGYIEKEDSKYKKLYVYASIVSEKKSDNNKFYLTKSPPCSSMLKPDHAKLKDWAFASLFDVVDVSRQNTIDLRFVLNELNIQQIDWFKTDSQGTDLRLFRSLGDDIIGKILIAEFEPGIMDAYEGEDKLYDVMRFLNQHPFWMSDMKVKGTQRIKRSALESYFSSMQKMFLDTHLRKSPCWAEITYLNSFTDNNLSLRDFLLGWVFATAEKQYGFAFELAEKGFDKFSDEIFMELKRQSLRKIKINNASTITLSAKKVLSRLANRSKKLW